MSGEWTPLATDFFHGPKVRLVGRDAALLYIAGLCYAQHHMTDGVIPAHVLDVLAPAAWVRPAAHVPLVEHGLWEPVDGGWFVKDWFLWNRSAEEIARRTENERKRKQGWRTAKAETKTRREQDASRDAGQDAPGDAGFRSTPPPPPIDIPLDALEDPSPQPVDDHTPHLAAARAARTAANRRTA